MLAPILRFAINWLVIGKGLFFVVCWAQNPGIGLTDNVKNPAGKANIQQTPEARNLASTPLVERSGLHLWANWPLKDFRHLDESAFLSNFKISAGGRYKNETLLLKQSLVGTRQEKKKAMEECAKRYGFQDNSELNQKSLLKVTVSPTQLAALNEPPTENNLGCLYWRILQLEMVENSVSNDQEMPTQIKSEKNRKKSLLALKKFKKRLPNNVAELTAFHGAEYYQVLDVTQFTSISHAMDFANLVIPNLVLCEYSNLGAAIIRNLEDLLPNSAVFDLMEKVSSAVNKCLSPASEAYEIVHLRMGLLHLERSNFSAAATHLELALLSQNPRDEYRALFWRGYLEMLKELKNAKPNRKENSYWLKLRNNYPLTLHALVADELLGHSAYNRIAGRDSPNVKLFIGANWNKYNFIQFLSAFFISKGDSVVLDQWSRFLSTNISPINFSSGLYVALTHLQAGNTRSAIKTVFDILRDFGNDQLDLSVLQLLYPLKFHEEVVKHSQGADAALVLSLIRQESSFNTKARSPVGASGLMQVMPATARSIAKRRNINLFDPVQNIKIGSAYLAKLLDANDENFIYTLASYNAGPRPVLRWRARYAEKIPLLFADLIPYPETRNYVSGLLRNMYWYRALLENFIHTKEDGNVRTWSLQSVAPRLEHFQIPLNANGLTILLDERKIDEAEAILQD